MLPVLGVAPSALVRGDVAVGHLAEGRDIGLGGVGGLGVAPVGDRIDLLEDHRPQVGVLDARLFDPNFGIGAERRFALLAAAPVAVGPVGSALAEGLEKQPLAVGIAAGSFDQALKALWIQLAHLSVRPRGCPPNWRWRTGISRF